MLTWREEQAMLGNYQQRVPWDDRLPSIFFRGDPNSNREGLLLLLLLLWQTARGWWWCCCCCCGRL